MVRLSNADVPAVTGSVRSATPDSDPGRLGPGFGIAIGPRLQRAVALAICASAGTFIASTVWQLVSLLAPALGLLLGGWFLATLLEPVVSSLEARTHARRWLAVLATFLMIALVLGVAVAGLGPLVSGQVNDSLAGLPALAAGAPERAADLQSAANEWFAQRHIALRLDLFSTASLEHMGQRVAMQLESSAIGPLVILGGVLGMFGTAVITLVLTVLILLGGHQSPTSSCARPVLHSGRTLSTC